MSVQLNHTIVSCRDQQRSAAFLTGILGLRPATRFGHFLVVEADNGVSLDFAETSGAITAQHYAFLVGEEEFDAAFGRIRQQDLPLGVEALDLKSQVAGYCGSPAGAFAGHDAVYFTQLTGLDIGIELDPFEPVEGSPDLFEGEGLK